MIIFSFFLTYDGISMSAEKINQLNEIENLLQQIINSEVPDEKLIEQFDIFREGLPYINLHKACTTESGIIQINTKEYDELLHLHQNAAQNNRISKFVPASGAATRMFKSLNAMFNNYPDLNTETLERLAQKDQDAKNTASFINNLREFAFFDELKNFIDNFGYNIESIIDKGDVSTILNFVLNSPGLDYSNTPKGLIKFHKYNDNIKSPVEEHIDEALEYASSDASNPNLHFTISPEHKALFKTAIDQYLYKFDREFNINFSFQKKATNTIAANLDNDIFFDDNNNMIFRPGGHGALLENLNDMQADIVFIKNIDNVQPSDKRKSSTLFKKVLCGFLLKIESQIHNFLHSIDDHNTNDEYINSIIHFIEKSLFIKIPHNITNNIEFIKQTLDRPIRVCGMVKNQGDPGGGPFQVIDKNGNISLQIVETAQINKADPNQMQILNSSTHFNPVDIVCSLKDYKKRNFDLIEYRDNHTGFISIKSKNGRELKALELPGLWNGSMANWITLFVEVPIDTFTPVKTVNDLLKDSHKT